MWVSCMWVQGEEEEEKRGGNMMWLTEDHGKERRRGKRGGGGRGRYRDGRKRWGCGREDGHVTREPELAEEDDNSVVSAEGLGIWPLCHTSPLPHPPLSPSPPPPPPTPNSAVHFQFILPRTCQSSARDLQGFRQY